MAFELSLPVADWPLLLCGPIVRRVTDSSVAVFVATSEACGVRLRIRERGTMSGWLASSAAADTRQIGQRLHVAVVELVGQALTSDTAWEYDVEMTPASGPAQGLADQPDLLTGPKPLGYADGAYPSFTPLPDLSSAHILHGSCRKPHGGGPDALTIVDDLIEAAHREGANAAGFAARRPHLLLLTGDQIYADDVSAALLLSLRSAATDLMGTFAESFPPGQLGFGAPEIQPGEARSAWLTANSELTSEHLDNHLMYLGEFYAMYLFCWSEVLWPTFLGGRTLYLNSATLYPSLSDPNASKSVKKAAEEQLKDADATLREAVWFGVDVRRVRRALANVPTMMAFDDHEITDDWNIDALWDQKARSDPALNRIVRNGLAAYAVFQSWGNDPGRFRSGTGKALLDALSAPPATSGVPAALADPPDPAVATLLDVGPTIAPNASRVLWDWTLDGPGLRVIALDSRTHRDFADNRHTGLVMPTEITRQLAAHLPAASDPRLCFVIAPAPVIGHPLVEEIAQPLMAATKPEVLGRRAADKEAWSANEGCLSQLLSTLAQFGEVVLLSGDVHYAYTNHTAYHGPAAGGVHARIVQLCSSAQKNTDGMTKIIQKAGYAGFELRGRGWFGTNRRPSATARDELMAHAPDPTASHPWDEVQLAGIIDALGETLSLGDAPLAVGRASAVLAKSVVVGANLQGAVADNALVQAYWLLTLARVDEDPLLLPDGPWFSAQALALVQGMYAGDPDAWRYKTEYVRDGRPAADRFTVVSPGTTPTAGTATGTTRQIIAQAHSVVGLPNIGEIAVRMRTGAPAQPLEVEHRLRWLLSNGERATTVHVAPLTRPVTSTGAPDQIPVHYQ